MTLQEALKSGKPFKRPEDSTWTEAGGVGHIFRPVDILAIDWDIKLEQNIERNEYDPITCYVFNDIQWKITMNRYQEETLVFPDGNVPMSLNGKRGKLIFIENE